MTSLSYGMHFCKVLPRKLKLNSKKKKENKPESAAIQSIQ